jgi:Na+-transporting NADH:ubiquinone oxidoreductase subunit NqrB
MVQNTVKLNSRDAAYVERERISHRYAFFTTVVRTLGVVSALYIAKEMIVSVAGQETFVALKLAFLADFKVSLSFVMTGMAGAWAFGERWLRHRTVAQLQARNKEFELSIDTKRTSSGLTPSGTTHPKDKRP